MNRDVVVGIVGAAVLVAAMVGVFTYERNVATAGTPGGEGAGANLTGPSASGTVAVGKSDEQIVSIEPTNATNVTFKLTWKATNGKDTLKLTISPPANLTAGGVSDPRSSGEITVTVSVPPGVSSSGQWKVKVDFVKAEATLPVTAVTPPTNPPNSTDASVAWSVSSTLQTK